jgi:fructokinase
MIRQAMVDWGMESRGLQTDSRLPTGRVNIEIREGEAAYDIISPCAYDAIDSDSIAVPGCDFLYHGSLALRADRSFQALQQLIDTKPSCLFVDVNLRAPWWDRSRVLSLMKKADWVKLNIDEFETLFPGSGPLENRLQGVIEALQLQAAILTHGAEGAEIMTAAGEHFQVSPVGQIDVVDTVGAGDSFTAVVILGLLEQWPIQTTLQRAQAMASRIVGQQGATISDPAFYECLQSAWPTDGN